MYFSTKSEINDLKRETVDIEIGKITPRGDGSEGICDIIANENINRMYQEE